jgi:hypothetical protein
MIVNGVMYNVYTAYLESSDVKLSFMLISPLGQDPVARVLSPNS